MPRCFGTSQSVRARSIPYVGLARSGGPDLLAVHHPLVAVALGPGGEAGEVRAAARLAEQLAPAMLAGDDRPQQPGLQVVGAVLEDGRRRPGSCPRPWPRPARRSAPAPRRPRSPTAPAGRGRTSRAATSGRPSPRRPAAPATSTAARSGSQCASSHTRSSARTVSASVSSTMAAASRAGPLRDPVRRCAGRGARPAAHRGRARPCPTARASPACRCGPPARRRRGRRSGTCR